MSSSSTATVLAGLDGVRDWQEELYRDLHAHPELSHQEHRTAARAAQRLPGLRAARCTRASAAPAWWPCSATGTGPTVLLRADMDALPVREETGLAYASPVTATSADGAQVPVMHACGHDVHVTCLLGAVDLLARAHEQWRGTLVAVFQPAEEVGDGARGMVEDGLAAIVGPVDVALGQHVLPFPAGRVATRPGPTLAAADSMRVTVHGRGAHGSMPQAAVDPVVLAAMIVVRLQTVVSRELRPGDPAVLTVGSIQAGTKSNVIPEVATILLNVRTYGAATRSTILAAIERIVRAECEASGCPAPPELELFDRFPVTDNDPAVTERVAAAFADHFGDRAQELPRADRQRGLQRHPDGSGSAVHLLGHGRRRPRRLRAGGGRGSGVAGRPGQPLRDVRPGAPADAGHRDERARRGRAGLARRVPVVAEHPRSGCLRDEAAGTERSRSHLCSRCAHRPRSPTAWRNS